MLEIEHCDRCLEPNVILITEDGERLCGKCAKIAMRCSRASDRHFKNKIYPVTEIDINCHLDRIVAQVMAFFITNGMTVRQCARQLGITHATVYTNLRKAGLMKPSDPADAILNPTIGDFLTTGAGGKEFKIVQITDHCEKPKKTVTTSPRGPASQVDHEVT
ncbi:unnamed protein product [marine sediment metagenome]|uniref:Uncharacterized protein n=1 Tax=marine sediment metagenome TaxID=412755 RepID=X1RYJ9_9ZZZZ